MGMDTEVMTMFWINQVHMLIKQFNMMETFKEDFSHQSKKHNPHPFLDNVLLNVWFPRLKAYLDIVAGINEIPLSYIIRDYFSPVLDPTAPILKQYLFMPPHYGPVYQEYNIKVFNMEIALVNDIQVGTANVKIFLAQSNGRVLEMVIATNYLGQVILNHELI